MTKTAKRRFCRIDGCDKIVKSQGLCQRHGAKTRLCKMDQCEKQAQGNFDGMCKSHFKESRVDLKETIDIIPSSVPPPPSGQSVYDGVIPASLAFVPNGKDLMPLVAHLKQGFDENRPRGWHRNDERRARGLWPVNKAAMQLQGWERELVWMEICILSGSNQASFRHLARAWGRDKGFHMVLAQFICERRGNVERKKRPKGAPKSDAEEFMDDILSFEDMDLPIEMLDAMRNDDHDDSADGQQQQQQDDSVEENEVVQQQQYETENVQSDHVPHPETVQFHHPGMMYEHAMHGGPAQEHVMAHQQQQEAMHEGLHQQQVPVQQHEAVQSHPVHHEVIHPGMVYEHAVHGQQEQHHAAVAPQEPVHEEVHQQMPVPQEESQDDEDYVDPLDLHLLMPHPNDTDEVDEPLQQQQHVQEHQVTEV